LSSYEQDGEDWVKMLQNEFGVLQEIQGKEVAYLTRQDDIRFFPEALEYILITEFTPGCLHNENGSFLEL